MKETILIKLSGGSLSKENNPYCHLKLVDICQQVKELSKTYLIGIVVGGGNHWRGRDNYLQYLSDHVSDYVGMVSTVLNGLVLSDYLEQYVHIKTSLYCALDCSNLTKPICPQSIREDLDNDKVLIFSGGTGMPYVSTDTCAAVMANQIGAKTILMGKDGVDGVYSCDPNKNKSAIFYDHITYKKLIQDNLKVIDTSALSICSNNNCQIIVFDQCVDSAFVKALNTNIKKTIIKN